MTALQKIAPDAASRLEIAHALERLGVSATNLATERSCFPGNVRGRVDCLLREIEETVIPRRIQIWRHDMVLAELDVSRRRCVAVGVIHPVSRRQSVDVSDPDALAQILVHLAQRVTRIKTVRLQSVVDASEHAGCSAADLKRMFHCERPACELTALLNLLGQDALAKLSWLEQPKTLDFSGEKNWRKFLLANAKKLRDQDRHERDDDGIGDVNGLAIPLTHDNMMVIGLSTAGGVAAILPRKSGMRAIAMWQLQFA